MGSPSSMCDLHCRIDKLNQAFKFTTENIGMIRSLHCIYNEIKIKLLISKQDEKVKKVTKDENTVKQAIQLHALQKIINCKVATRGNDAIFCIMCCFTV